MPKLTDAEILYRYGIYSVLPMLKAGGTWIAPAPAPLSSAVIIRELERIAEHKNYKQHTISFRSGVDGGWVLLKDGEVRKVDQATIATLDGSHRSQGSR